MKKYTKPAWVPDWISIAADGRLSWYDGGAKGSGKRRQKRCGTTAAAEAEAQTLVRSMSRRAGLKSAPGATWADLCQAWSDAHDGLLPEGTFRRRLTGINAWVVPHAGHVKVADTDLSTLLLVADALVLAATGPSNFDSVTQTMAVLSDWARERNWLPADPFGTEGDRKRALRSLRRRLANPSTRSAASGDEDRGIALTQVPTWDDVDALAKAVANRVGGLTASAETAERYARAIRVAAGTGLRQCELLALTADRVDMATGLITVDRQLDRYTTWVAGDPMPTSAPKFGRARTVVAWAKVRDDLAALIADAGDDGVLVPPYDAQTWWADAWGRMLLAARDDIAWGWMPHWLRHHYGSVSLAPRDIGGFGLPPAEVQLSLGHKSLTTTLETYIQPTRAITGWVV